MRARIVPAVPVFAATLLATFGCPQNTRARCLFVAFLVLLAFALPAEWMAAESAYETIGEITSGVYFLVILTNIVPIAAFASGLRRTGIILAVAIFLLIVPGQADLAYRGVLLKDEASRIITYAYGTRARTGAFPADLYGYRFRHEDLSDHFDYSLDAKTGAFSLDYYVGTKGTSHWYKSMPGTDEGWGYYPD